MKACKNNIIKVLFKKFIGANDKAEFIFSPHHCLMNKHTYHWHANKQIMHAYFVQYGEYAILMSLVNNESLMTALDATGAFFSLIYHTHLLPSIN